jgi:hypothetical protein
VNPLPTATLPTSMTTAPAGSSAGRTWIAEAILPPLLSSPVEPVVMKLRAAMSPSNIYGAPITGEGSGVCSTP